MNQSNCMVAQSGGPTVAINASLAGVIQGVMDSDQYNICYGAVNGVLGILNENYLNLTGIVSEDAGAIDRLKTTPAMYLGSCRHKLPNYKDDDSPYVFIFNQFAKLHIKAFFYIGGNDSMDTVLKLSDYAKKINSDIRIIGVPKTIDNDLCVTDHTPGFGSAAKYIATSLLEIAHDTFIYAVKSVTIVEIMGRDAGWLTAASALARNEYNTAPHLIYLPETVFDKEQFLDDVRSMLKHRNNVIVAVSEGIRLADGRYVCELGSSGDYVDAFGHKQLTGTATYLANFLAAECGCKTRAVELSTLQRSASHMASRVDIDEAFMVGGAAVKAADEGDTGKMIVIDRVSDDPYMAKTGIYDVHRIANEEKLVPRNWMNKDANNVTKDFVDYISPLIQGDYQPIMVNGLPRHLVLKQKKKR